MHYFSLYIDLSSNRISHIEDYCFLFMKKLRYIDLSHNRLQSISRNAFTGLSSLEHLVLSNNNISYIHDEAFQATAEVRERQFETVGFSAIRLYLDNNPVYVEGLDNGVLVRFR
jgi:Leucine-rich repeat (LRR) protein